MAEKSDETVARATDLQTGDAPTQHAPLSGPASGTLRSAPAVGQRIGRYVVERTIGHGGMGIVVAARHEQLDELVAIKLLHPKAAKDAVQVERFVREARATVRIKSEHVVRVLDAGADESTGAPFIVMEHLEGRDLGAILSSHGAMPMQMAVDYTIHICEAVAAAHALGIIHRDLKPSNFFLTHLPDGTPLVKVLDFGISKAAQADGTPDPRLTETQAVFGSPTYMSPEQIRSSKNVDPRSDVWSLGVALFEMMTAKLPFEADNVAGLLASVIADAPLRVSAFVPHVPADLEAAVLGCLEKDPARRIPSTAELAMRLAPFASAEGARLAARVERVRGSMASGLSFPPSAPHAASQPPPPLHAGAAPTMHAAGMHALQRFGPTPPISHPSAPVSFGTTGTDLSATGPAAHRMQARSNAARTVAIAAAAVVLLCVLGGIAYVARARQAARAEAEAAAAAASLASAPASAVASSGAVEPTPSSVASSASTELAAEPAASAALAKGNKGRPVPGLPGKGAPRASAMPSAAHPAPGAPAGPVAPVAPVAPPAAVPSANLDSRF